MNPRCPECAERDALAYSKLCWECVAEGKGGAAMNTLDELQKVSEIRAQLESELAQARADAAKLAKKAMREGASGVDTAKAAGVSRVTLYEMLKRA